MLLTRASEYALIAIIVIAQNDTPQGVNELSKSLDISRSFLAKILQNMAKRNILVSFKGAKGGFSLARKAKDISILEIIKACDESSGIVFACSVGDKCCPSKDKKEKICTIWPLLNKIQNRVDSLMDDIKLSDLLG